MQYIGCFLPEFKGKIMMTKKQFEAIAKIISRQGENDDYVGNDYEQGWDGATEVIARRLADYFAGQNPRFDRGQFMDACGLPPEL